MIDRAKFQQSMSGGNIIGATVDDGHATYSNSIAVHESGGIQERAFHRGAGIARGDL
jgi:hypothetical protein